MTVKSKFKLTATIVIVFFIMCNSNIDTKQLFQNESVKSELDSSQDIDSSIFKINIFSILDRSNLDVLKKAALISDTVNTVDELIKLKGHANVLGFHGAEDDGNLIRINSYSEKINLYYYNRNIRIVIVKKSKEAYVFFCSSYQNSKKFLWEIQKLSNNFYPTNAVYTRNGKVVREKLNLADNKVYCYKAHDSISLKSVNNITQLDNLLTNDILFTIDNSKPGKIQKYPFWLGVQLN
jgi:hypothetical protein